MGNKNIRNKIMLSDCNKFNGSSGYYMVKNLLVWNPLQASPTCTLTVNVSIQLMKKTEIYTKNLILSESNLFS